MVVQDLNKYRIKNTLFMRHSQIAYQTKKKLCKKAQFEKWENDWFVTK